MSYLETFRKVWSRVRKQYALGSCVSERGLQAVLYSELRLEFPERAVIVEPRWKGQNRSYVPDIVVVEDGVVSDVFEIKFVPHSYAHLRSDIQKLIDYGTAIRECAIAIDPLTGRYGAPLTTADSMRRHYVAIANSGAAAVWMDQLTREVPELASYTASFYHWFGRIGARELDGQEWDVSCGA